MKNKATEVRQGEELPEGKLLQYLNQNLDVSSEELKVQQYPAGFSNLTYLVEHGDRKFVLRRPPHGAQVKSGHDMSREFTVLSELEEGYSKSPKPILLCNDETIIGAPFYLMEKVDGIILRANPKAEWKPNREQMETISNDLIKSLAELHTFDFMATRLNDLGKPNGYVGRQISGWTRRYEKSATEVVAAMDSLADWLGRNQPAKSLEPALIHNDFKYDNVVLDPTNYNIRAVLDWEMCTIGDPLMDLGTSLGYWVDANDPDALKTFALSPTLLEGNLNREQVVEAYFSTRNLHPVDMSFYYAFGLFKIAVIVQQIYYRYFHGYTKDPRFAHLIHAVHGLGAHGYQVAQQQRISNLY